MDTSLERLRLLRNRLDLFGKTCLKVRTKDAQLVPFEMNHAQQELHQRIEAQRKEKGFVRVLVLKGRQMGISTYVAARFYHKATTRKNINVYIMAHEQTASDSLFSIVDRYQTHNPIRPQTGAANVKELEFSRLESSYIVATAGQKASGRSRTFSLYHGSEVAFWSNPEAHFAGSVQAVPDVAGTEIILESTAFGPTGEFHRRWREAVAGEGEYIAVFLPWFDDPGYSRPDLVKEGFELSTVKSEDEDVSEAEYAELFGLSLAQMAWRRNKIRELGVRLFRQEYPAYPDEAFQSAVLNSYIPTNAILRARKRKEIQGAGPLIMGVDPSGPGGDRFSVALRRGYVCEDILARHKLETSEAVYWVKSLIDQHNPDEVNIDAGGIGYPVISLLREQGVKYERLINAINFGSPSQLKRANPKLPGPKNRRAEMWTRLKEWLELDEGVAIPDDDELHADLSAVTLKPTGTNDILLLSKEDMRSKGLRSPDKGDALALTFALNRHIKTWNEPAAPVRAGEPESAQRRVNKGRISGRNSWMA